MRREIAQHVPRAHHPEDNGSPAIENRRPVSSQIRLSRVFSSARSQLREIHDGRLVCPLLFSLLSRFYFWRSLRRITPIVPIKPVPNRTSELGSGTVEGDSL